MLEACRSSALSDRPIFGSVAPALLESGVGSVIAFSHSVHIEASRLLVERFYKELADGLTVGQALEEARSRLRAEPKRWLSLGPDPETIELQDWFIPQLYQVGPDNVYMAYSTLAKVARDRGDAEAGAAWQAKHDSKVAELERLHCGDDDAPVQVPTQLRDAILALARAVHDARTRGASLPADASEALAQLDGLPPPLGAVGTFLRDVAGGGALPSVPEGLPSEIGEVLKKLVEAVEE